MNFCCEILLYGDFLFVFMKLKQILLAGALLFSSVAFSQEQFKFNIYGKGEKSSGQGLKIGFLKVTPKKIDVSFWWRLYSLEFQKISDSTYREVVKDKIPFSDPKHEFFNYSFKDSCYTLENYFTEEGKPREEKEALEGRVFNKKYKSLPELFNNFENGLLKDSIHFVVLGMPYSVKIETRENQDSVIYSCNLENIIKREPGDNIIFPYPIKAYTIKREGGLLPVGFSTEFLRVRSGKRTSIKGELRKR